MRVAGFPAGEKEKREEERAIDLSEPADQAAPYSTTLGIADLGRVDDMCLVARHESGGQSAAAWWGSLNSEVQTGEKDET